MNRVSYFEMSALDMKRAIKFYEKVFKWKFEKWGDDSMEYWMIKTGPDKETGIDGGKIIVDKSAIPGYGYYATFEDSEGNLMSVMEEDSNAQ